MKSRLLITGMIVAIAISATYVSFAYNQEIKLATGMMTSGETGPRHVPDPICFVIDRTTSGQTENAVILEKCYPLSDFVNMGCGYLMLEHLYNHSNLLDEEFDGKYSMEEIGLSDGLSVEKFNECVDFIFEKRTLLSESVVTDSLKISNTERDAKIAAGYKLYSGVGWVHPDDLGNQQPVYMDNPDNPGELILDIDAMQQVQEILDYCGPPKYQGFAYGLEYSNGTHIIDNDTCEWRKIK